jgi:uncharacterized protein (DUF1800 family)
MLCWISSGAILIAAFYETFLYDVYLHKDLSQQRAKGLPISSGMKRREVLKAGTGTLGAAGLLALGLNPSQAKTSAQPPSFKPLYKKKDKQKTLSSLQGTDSFDPIATVPTAEIRALRRLTFGYKPQDLAAFLALGGNFNLRLQKYVNDQLDNCQSTFPPTNDPDLMAELNKPSTGFTTLQDSLQTLWQDRVVAAPDWPIYTYPLVDTQYLTLLRCVHSKWQLAEILADFWHTHFSVEGSKFEVAPVFVHYDRDVIRPNMLGNFRQMLEAVTKSTAMMRYLDNASNTRWGPNENFARELQELHTLGAVHSYGFTPEQNIPAATPIAGSSAVLPAGLKAGYSEQDVRQATLCLTGWTISTQWSDGLNNGQYLYQSNWHDESSKHLLGIDITGSGEAEVEQILDMLAVHPNTARYVCQKLCKRLIGDNPPDSIVESAALVFNDQWQSADQLKQVVKTIILSDEFKDSANWGAKTKKPYELIAGTLRSCGGVAGKLARPDMSDYLTNLKKGKDFAFSQSLHWMLGDTGNRLFSWATPDGFPDNKPAWLGSTPLVMGWRVINSMFLSSYPDDPDDPDSDWSSFYPVDVVVTTSGVLSSNDRTARNIVNYWINQILGYDADNQGSPQLDARITNKLIAFMQQDAASPDTALVIDSNVWSDQPWQAYVGIRLQTLVASIAMLPDNLLR